MIEMNFKNEGKGKMIKRNPSAKSIDRVGIEREFASRTIISSMNSSPVVRVEKKEREEKNNAIVKRTRDGTKTSSKRIFRFLPRGKRVEKRRRIPIYTYSRDPRKACAVTERTSAHALRDAPWDHAPTLFYAHDLTLRTLGVYSHSCLIYMREYKER